MITDQPSIRCFPFLSKFLPFFTFLHYFIFLQVKVTTDNWLKSFGRVLYVFKHCIFDVTISHDVCVSFVLLLSLNCSLLVFESWFVEVNILTHDNWLDRHQNLKKSWDLCVPVLHSLTSPGPQQTQANFSTCIKVGIKSNLSATGCHQVNFWRIVGVSIIEVDIKEISPMAIRSSVGPHDHSLHEVNSLLIASHIDSIGVIDRKSMRDVSKFLGKSDSLINRRLMPLLIVAGVVMFCDFVVTILHVNVVEPQVLHENGVFFVQWQFHDLLVLCIVFLTHWVWRNSLIYNVECLKYLLCYLLWYFLRGWTCQARQENLWCVRQSLQQGMKRLGLFWLILSWKRKKNGNHSLVLCYYLNET